MKTLLSAFLSITVATIAQAQGYSFKPLPELPLVGISTAVRGVSEDLTVLVSCTGTASRIWSPSKGYIALPKLEGQVPYVERIDGGGVVHGNFRTHPRTGFRWSASHGFWRFPLLEGHVSFTLVGASRAGHSTGLGQYAWNSGMGAEPVLYSPEGDPILVAHLVPAYNRTSNDVNSEGDFVGKLQSTDQNPPWQAFAVRGGQLTVVDALGGYRHASFEQINDRGVIAGTIVGPPQAGRAALWSDAAGWSIILDPAVWSDSYPSDLNDLGAVVLNPYPNNSAVNVPGVWTPSKGFRPLSQLVGPIPPGWVINNVSSITNKGVIGGNAKRPDGYFRAFLVFPPVTKVEASLVGESGVDLGGGERWIALLPQPLSLAPEAAAYARTTLKARPEYLWLTAEARTTGEGPSEAHLQVMDLTTGQWDTLDVSRTALGREWQKVELVLTGDLGRYIALDGTVSVRVGVRSSGPQAHLPWRAEIRGAAFEVVYD